MALLKEQSASNVLIEINDDRRIPYLYTRLGNALQFRIETNNGIELSRNETPEKIHKDSNPTMFSEHQRKQNGLPTGYFQALQVKYILRAVEGKTGHTIMKFKANEDLVRIYAAKAKFLERKSKYRRPGMVRTEQVRFELDNEMREIIYRSDDSHSDNPENVFP